MMPAITTVDTSWSRSSRSRSVPAKPLTVRLRTTSSPSMGASGSKNSIPQLPSVDRPAAFASACHGVCGLMSGWPRRHAFWTWTTRIPAARAAASDATVRPSAVGGPAVPSSGCGAAERTMAERAAAVDRAIDAMRPGVEAGMTWIDTAEIYGTGRSEELVARALEDRPDVLVFTKVWHGVHGALTRDVMRAAAEASLDRLGRDAIDLYLLLEADPARAVEDTWETMAALADEGLVG